MSMPKIIAIALTALFLTAVPPSAASALVPEGTGPIPVRANDAKIDGPPCGNQLVKWIYEAGFRGQNIREAWAIAMRESNGRPATVSNGVDHGLFQFNQPSWGGQSWWNTSKLLTPVYNAKVAYKMSKGGKNWGPWGMRDHAEWNFASYGMWSDWQIQNWIIGPYMKYYHQFPKKCAKNL